MSTPLDKLDRLSDLIARLRGPDGCPWDRDQGIDELRAYLLEEAHEVAAAIDSEDWTGLRDELGDLLFQLVFIARLAEELSEFDLDEVVDRIESKMIARHPHVFGEEILSDSDAVRHAWERRKLDDGERSGSFLEGVPGSLPALIAAYRMTQKAAGVGFDWTDAQAVLDKVNEEVAELRDELLKASGPDREAIRGELGDVLFTIANLARHLDIDPEAALARANLKFRDRFARLEALLSAADRSLADATSEEMESAWSQVKSEDPH